MNLQSLTTVALRVLSLYAGVELFGNALPKLIKLILQMSSWNAYALALMGGLIVGAMMLVLVMVLWKCAKPIAEMATRNLPEEVALPSLSLADGYSMAFMAVAIFCIGGTIDRAIEWAYHYLKLAATTAQPLIEQIKLTDFLYAFSPLIFGIILLKKGRSWALKLAKQHLDAEQKKPAAM
ncbi:MAG: hypothetical protein NT105_13585 [Verrucomicrobia bacterium]|nr:hypothetical protein [Verrucomicrobiota bacterium]